MVWYEEQSSEMITMPFPKTVAAPLVTLNLTGLVPVSQAFARRLPHQLVEPSGTVVVFAGSSRNHTATGRC